MKTKNYSVIPPSVKLPNRVEILVVESVRTLCANIVAASAGWTGMTELTHLSGKKFYAAKNSVLSFGENDDGTATFMVFKNGSSQLVTETVDHLKKIYGYIDVVKTESKPADADSVDKAPEASQP
jgi:hypothetical protein